MTKSVVGLATLLTIFDPIIGEDGASCDHAEAHAAAADSSEVTIPHSVDSQPDSTHHNSAYADSDEHACNSAIAESILTRNSSQDDGECAQPYCGNGVEPAKGAEANPKPQEAVSKKRAKASNEEGAAGNTTAEAAVSAPKKLKAKPSVQEDEFSEFECMLEAVEISDIKSDFEGQEEELQEIEAVLAEKDAISTGVNQTFESLVKKFNVPGSCRDLYQEWLLKLENPDGTKRFKECWLPKAKKTHVKPGIRVPPPYGRQWHELILERRGVPHLRSRDKYAKACELREDCTLAAISGAIRAAVAIKYIDNDIEAHAAKKRRKKDNEHAQKPPASISKALHHENIVEAYKWLESIDKEWDGLNDLEVFKHNYTRQQLRDEGITATPIPFSVCLDFKFDKEGRVDRYKTRFALAGHSGNVQKGVHFDKTFAATPREDSVRILQAIMVKFKMFRKAFDIKQAYCNAKLEPGQMLAVRYPDGLRRFSEPDQDGHREELFMVLQKNLYGLPQAGRLWEQERHRRILCEFNKGPWKCKKCIKEPSLYYITHESTDVGKDRILALVHTDDVDAVGDKEETLEEFYSIVKSIWEVKEVDPAYMLGITRTITREGEEMSVELTMQAFIESMEKEFPAQVRSKALSVPFPEGAFLYRKETSDEEAKAVLEEGYQKLVGMALWAARGVFPECQLGANQLGRVMDRPNREAWKCGIHMLNYLIQNKNRGIKFSSTGNSVPVAYFDASNKPDPVDSKCQYGTCHMWQGGPICTASKKLGHVGLSASHNEYMAMHWCNRTTSWLRDLLQEIDMGDVVAEPTLTYGDNLTANALAEEDMVTKGNQFYRVQHHYNKECQREGICDVKWISSEENFADIFTKAVPRQVLERLLTRLTGYA